MWCVSFEIRNASIGDVPLLHKTNLNFPRNLPSLCRTEGDQLTGWSNGLGFIDQRGQPLAHTIIRVGIMAGHRIYVEDVDHCNVVDRYTRGISVPSGWVPWCRRQATAAVHGLRLQLADVACLRHGFDVDVAAFRPLRLGTWSRVKLAQQCSTYNAGHTASIHGLLCPILDLYVEQEATRSGVGYQTFLCILQSFTSEVKVARRQ